MKRVDKKNQINQQIKLNKLKKYQNRGLIKLSETTQFLSARFQNYYKLQSYIMESSQRKISKQESDNKKMKQARGSDENENGQSQSDNGSEDSDQQNSFVVGDDFQDQFSDQDYDSKSNKKKKKQKKGKKSKKKKKRKRRGSDSDSVIADDLQVVDGAQQNLRRLKKNKDKAFKQNQDDYGQQLEDYDDNNQIQQQDYDSGFGRNQYEDQSSQSVQVHKKDEQANLDDLLDERVRKQYFAETTDKQIVDMDLPQRQIIKYKNYAKILNSQIQTIQKDFQSQQRVSQARWIFKKLRNMGNFEVHDEKQCRSKIQNVLVAMHRQHLDVMYIYYYRKKIWADALNLNLLIKIQQIDEEWMTFKRQFKALQDDITSVIPSFQHVPRAIYDALSDCTDFKQLKYFKDYTNFIMSKRRSDLQIKLTNKRQNVIKQICDSGIDTWLSNHQPFLSPHNFYQNIKDRMQRRKPMTPQSPPDKVLRKLLRQKGRQQYQGQNKHIDDRNQQNEDKNRDWSNTPLLSPEKRISTLIDYIAIELFNYPQIRRSLKQKYYRKLLISTTPTSQGSHHINIYNTFFPVKRIKDKPVSSLRKQLWILAKEAEKQNLITIQLKFQWELSSSNLRNFQGDHIYGQLVKYYFDINSHSSGQNWNLLRKTALVRMLSDHFLPAFLQEVKDDLTRDGTKEIIQSCCHKFRNLLKKGPSLKQNQPIKILGLVLEQQKLGIAFVDEQGKEHTVLSIQLRTDDELKKFVSDEILRKIIDQNRPDMILVAANCRRAQTLRKQLRNPTLFSQAVYCEFGEYQVPSLMANKNIIQGVSSQKCILQAISMARFKKNPMAEILALWSDSIEENGVYSMNLHPLQKYINKRKLIDSLQRVAIQVVNMVGLDIDDIRNSDHCRNVLQFLSGLGPRKAFDLIEKVKQKYPPTRKHLLDIVKGTRVYVNCSPFIKFQRPQHFEMIQKFKSGRQQYKKQKMIKHKSKDSVDRSQINLLDMTRIPQEWYALTQKLFLQAMKPFILEFKHKKSSHTLTDEQISVRQMFKQPQKLRNVDWGLRKDENYFYDENLVKSQIMNPFKDPRDQERAIQNRDIFYSLLKQSPQTLKKYMVVTVRILSVNQQFLNVVIPENGLFGFIKLPIDRSNDRNNKPKYQKGMFIKAVITGFPFDERRQRQRQEGDQQQQLLKVDMALNFPHRSDDKNHDCNKLCFPSILKEIHPTIDLEKQNFDLSKQSMPVVQVKEETVIRPKTEFKRISHPKFKNINLQTAIQQVKQLKIGDFIIRPSTEGSNFLTITWHFYKGNISHIKLRCQQRPESGAMLTYRVLDKNKDKVYASIDQVIDRYLKPMNNLVQDVISNKKFIPMPLQQIQQKVKLEANKQQSYIQYFFGCSPQFPEFFILVYLYKEKKPTKQLIKVKNDGLHFHDQIFNNVRELIAFFKQNLKDKRYQQFIKQSNNPFKKVV